jgi:pyruvate formate lyase activating enzyme
MRAGPEISYVADRCLAECRRCIDACEEKALFDRREGRVDWSRCSGCGRCVEVCPTAALRRVGRRLGIDALLAEVLRDVDFFRESGGGITLSGGEPVLHSRFLEVFLPRAKQAGLDVTIETAGHYPFELIEPLLAFLDLVLFDVKLMDSAEHRAMTGRDNETIHQNLRRLVERGVRVEVRMPVIPGCNTAESNVAATAGLLRALGVRTITLLPYNHLWEAKLPTLGQESRSLGLRPPDEAVYAGIREGFARAGVEARL